MSYFLWTFCVRTLRHCMGGSREGNFNGMSCNTLHANRRKGFTRTFYFNFRNSAMLRLSCLFNFECLMYECKFGEFPPPTSLGPPASRNISSPFPPPPPPPPQKPLNIATLHSLPLSPLAWAFDSPTTDGDDAIGWRPHFSRTSKKKENTAAPSHVPSPAKIAGRSDRGFFVFLHLRISSISRFKKIQSCRIDSSLLPPPLFYRTRCRETQKILLS